MRNEPNFRKSQMFITVISTTNYNEKWTMDSWSKRTQTKPIYSERVEPKRSIRYDGFTITKGNADGSYQNSCGGGIYCSGTSPTINNCIIKNNNAIILSSGIFTYLCSATITNCFFAYNTGARAMYTSEGSPTVTNCVFTRNEEGAIENGYSPLGGSLTLTNCTFTKNGKETIYGGAVTSTENAVAYNCIFWGNYGMHLPGVYDYREIDSEGTLTFICCDIRDSKSIEYPVGGNKYIVDDSYVSGDPGEHLLGNDGGGNIDADPEFSNADSPAGPDGLFSTWDDGLRLTRDSSCIDAADGDAAPSTDILGWPRIDIHYDADNTGVGEPDYADMGAYEFIWEPLVHFTGIFIGCEYIKDITSEIFVDDKYSEILGCGVYPDAYTSLGQAREYSFDGIAISTGTRLIMYSEEGDVLLDKTGPAVIYNVYWINDDRYNWVIDEIWPEPLQSEFPRSVREWSDPDKGDMRYYWVNGSFKIE